ncbi:EF-hand calcium-binding domain-containing protein 14-like [Lytechinus pictus]|uniref:EF-hand calcium-binding domain-containing protein 14-like n=1 Tax=Lytechinus pictus TaxID=7653 RepID=UPI0030BA21BB
MCVPLVMFILTMGCMVITGGLIWMHFNLKQDLDNLRKTLEKVEIKADSASSQEKTIVSLETGLERLGSFPEKVDIADIKINILNKSLSDIQKRQDELDSLKTRIESLEGKASSTSAAELQQNVAELGSEIEDLKGKHDEQEMKIAGYEQKITELMSEVNTLKSQVALLQNPPSTPPSPEVAPPTTSSATTRHSTPAEPATGSGSSISDPHFIEIQEEISRIWAAVHEVQSTASNLSREHDEVVSSLSQFRQMLQNSSVNTQSSVPTVASHSSSSPQSIQTGQFDLAQMKADIELLKEEYNKSIVSMPVTDIIPVGDSSSLNTTGMRLLTERVTRLEERVNELKPVDSNPDLLNINVTNSMQMLLERSLQQFKDENIADVSALQEGLAAASSFDDEVGTRIASIQDQISTLQRETCKCTSTTSSPAEGALPLITSSSTISPVERTGGSR